MALLNKKEFAAKCGIKTNQISIYASRGKIVLSGDYIDDSIQKNADFILARAKEEGGASIPVLSNPNVTPVAESAPEKPNTKAGGGGGESLYALEKKRKEVSIEKTEEEIQLLQKKKEKLQGILIPTEAVRMVFIRNSKGITTAFHQAADNLLVEFATLKKLSSKEVAEMRAKLIKVVNKAVEDGIKESKKEIAAIVSEYSETRGKGERK